MSRRGKTIEKRVTLDPKYNSELVAHMIRVIMKDGKKTVAEKIVYGAIDKVAEKMKAEPAKFVKDEKPLENPLDDETDAATLWTALQRGRFGMLGQGVTPLAYQLVDCRHLVVFP